MENHPIPVGDANIMIEEYIKNSKELEVNPTKKTYSVSFTAPDLMKWLSQTMPLADELRVCLAMYPKDHVHAGRVTVILWPYKDGAPATHTTLLDGKDAPPPPPEIPPYNAGGLNP